MSMGNSQSKATKEYKIAEANLNAPAILRTFNLLDFDFQYTKARQELVPKIHLANKLNEINSKFSANMRIRPIIDNISSTEEQLYNYLVNTEENAFNGLKNGKLKDIYYRPSSDQGQLYLCRQYIINISEGIDVAQDIKILQMCCNYITTLPPAIGFLRNLNVLVLSRNLIRELPEEIGLLENLKELNLSKNLLKSLPKSITNMKKMNILHLEENLFETIPAFIGKITSLKYLDISCNKITKIPLEILKLPYLIELKSDEYKQASANVTTDFDTLTLKEICSRQIIRNNISVSKHLNSTIINYLLSAKECCFCSGPYFDYFVEVQGMHVLDSKRLPIEYRMCSKHYSQHDERLEALFSSPFDDTSRPAGEMPNVTEMFLPLGYDNSLHSTIRESWKNVKKDKVPLVGLSRFNSPLYNRLLTLDASQDSEDKVELFKLLRKLNIK